MTKLAFNSNYKSWLREYETKLIYTQKEFKEALAEQERQLVVNRVIQCPEGNWNTDVNIALQILHVHKTESGLLVLVK